MPEGVYAAHVWIEGKRYKSAVFCGVAEMFHETEPKLEAHVLDFFGDLTNQEITVELLQKIRETRAFATPEELIDQIELDIKTIRACLQE